MFKTIGCHLSQPERFGSFLSAVERCQFSLLLVVETLYIKWQYDCFPSGGIDFVAGLHAEVTFVSNVFCFKCLWRTEAFAMNQRNLFCYAVNYHVAFISTSGSFGSEDQQITHLGGRIKAFGGSLILAHGDANMPWNALDCAAAVSYLELALHSYGIGTCWSGFVIAAAGNGVDLGIPLPEGRKICGGLMIGYPAVQYARVPPRKPVRLTVIE